MPDAASMFEDIRIQYEECAPDLAVVRIRNASPDVFEQLGAAFGVAWPRSPAGVVAGVFCVGPNEWMIHGRAASDVERAVKSACEGALYHVADVGAGRRLWRIGGAPAPDLLSRGAALDFHPSIFAPGAAAFTMFAQLAAVISRPGETLNYQLIADASYAHYLNAWFERATRDL